MQTLSTFSNQPLDRSEFLKLTDTALQVKEFAYARLLALAWLSTFPGDLGVGMRHAQALTSLKLHRQAIPVLEAICQADPEFLEAQQLLAECAGETHHPMGEEAQASVIALSGQVEGNHPARPVRWGKLLKQAKSVQAKALNSGSPSESERPGGSLSGEYGRLVHAALLENPSSPLAALIHLYFMRENSERGEILADSVTSLARAYHARWPRCLAFSLILANQLMDHGAGEEAVALLHQVAARDVTAQVAIRIWGENHPYRSLWPEKLVIEPVPSLAGATSPQGLPIPAGVAAALGWNQLATGSLHPNPAAPSSGGKDRRAIHAHTGRGRGKNPERIAGQKGESAKDRPDGPYRPADFPVYVIFSDRQMLQRVYGLAAARRIEAAAKQLVRSIANRPDWDAMLHLLPPRQAPYTPWDLKLALADLDKSLAVRGERIGAVLILGGPEIVPFHHLPNPVDDSDDAIPSDNPYATRDENYFVAEWPVGRLPGGAGNDPTLLIEGLKRFADFHARWPENSDKQQPWLQSWLRNLRQLVFPTAATLPAFLHANQSSSYGYTAAVWQRASVSVFRPIGLGSRLKVSPPLAIDANGPDDRPQLKLPPARLAYFNLHGQRDSAVWYGQSDPTSPVGAAQKGVFAKGKKWRKAAKEQPDVNAHPSPLANPDFPVALRPVDIFPQPGARETGWWSAFLDGLGLARTNAGAPAIIFSEACFGAHIEGRSPEQAIALTFLRAGCSGFVGSTCIAYGAISTPLTAADLLGHTFWQYISDGHPSGEALRRAKLYLSTEMDRRQGYLDGEDQKTLISFVLYGDPLHQLSASDRAGAAIRTAKNNFSLQPGASLASGSLEEALARGLEPAFEPVPVVCDRLETQANGGAGNAPGTVPGTGEISPELLASVRQVVSKYLPGMTDANLKLAPERGSCQAHGHTCPTAQLGAKSASPEPAHPDRRVVTLSKTITRPVMEKSEGNTATITHQQFARLTLDASSKVVKLVVSR